MEPTVTHHGQTLEEMLSEDFLYNQMWLGPIIAAMYLILVKVLQVYMENKPAHSLKTVIRIYNVIQVSACAKLVLMTFKYGIWPTFWRNHCRLGDDSISFFIAMRDSDICLFAFCLRVFDALDTMFIILKKKSAQLSFLHIFHHSAVIAGSTIMYNDLDLSLFPIVILNSFVHTFMYSYYFIVSFESQQWVTKYKKYITQLQLAQFGIAGLFLCYAIIAGCQWKRNTVIILYLLLSVLIYEFGKFYIVQYINKKRKAE